MTTSITLRSVKGSPLTWNEVDDNFSNLKATADAAAVAGSVTSSGLTMSTNRLLGRATASSGVIEELSIGTNLSISGGTLNVDLSAYLTTSAASSTYQPLDGDLTAIAAISTNGVLKRTGTDTWAVVTAPTGDIVGTSDTQTLTNKRVTPRVLASTANSATPTLNTDLYDMMVITGQSTAITSFTTNLSGTPTNGQKLWISVTGTTAIAITWGASFEASTVALPTTTVTTARLDVGFVWNAATSKWRCVASA